MDVIGTYHEREFPAFRNPTIDILEMGCRKHHIPVLLEIDVTEARKLLHHIKVESGLGISFTAWVMKCVGQAVSEHKYMHALRKGRRRLIVFDDVDMSVVIEREVRTSDNQSETLPMPCVVRKVNEKSVKTIHNEIRAAQEAPVQKDAVQIGSSRRAAMTRAFSGLPHLLRNLIFWWPVMRNPFLAKRTMGTVVVTSIGSMGKGNGSAWAIPSGIHSLIVAVGGIAKKPGIVGETIQIRQYLSVTVLFDHDVTDGAPVARFIQRLKALLESCHGLDEVTQTGSF